MKQINSILPGPHVRFKDSLGKTYVPETIRIRVVVFVQNKRRWSVNLELFNRRDLIEQSESIVPEHFRRNILTAEICPRKGNCGPGDICSLIRFDCRKDGL